MPTARNPSADEVAALSERVADRLRHLSTARLQPIAAQVAPLLARLAGLAGDAQGVVASPLDLPGDRAWGDVVDVLGASIANGLRHHPHKDVAEQARLVLTELRRVLP